MQLETIQNKIHLLRGAAIMIDYDLAKLYGVETRVLNQAVKRNIYRFPEDFMFQLTEEETDDLISQIVISSHGGRRKRPYAFTQNGIAMLSSVLKSEMAIKVNIEIMRVFVKTAELLRNQMRLYFKIEEIARQSGKNEKDIEAIFAAIEYLHETLHKEEEKSPLSGKRKIGFH